MQKAFFGEMVPAGDKDCMLLGDYWFFRALRQSTFSLKALPFVTAGSTLWHSILGFRAGAGPKGTTCPVTHVGMYVRLTPAQCSRPTD